MNAGLAAALAGAAVTVGALHSLAPDHWLPIAAVGRARAWSMARTLRIALLCGFGHVTTSVALGLVGLVTGREAVHAFGTRTAAVSGLLLIGFGIVYALWGLRHAVADRLHGHHHDHRDHVHDPGRKGVWALFAIYCADPCIAVIPILFAAAPLPIGWTVAVVAAYEVATIATMVGLVGLARAGAGLLPGRWRGGWADGVAGASIAVTGVAVALLGW